MTTFSRGDTPNDPGKLPTFLRKELEKIQRAFGSISTTWASITGKPTTIAGFGITDAYSKTEVDADVTTINATIAALNVLQARTPLVITTAALADLTTESSNKVMPHTTMNMLLLQADRACWVRLYGSAAAAAADIGRAITAVGTAGTGLLADIRFTGASTVLVSPNAWLSNQEVPSQKRIFYAIQNRSGGLSTVTVTASLVPVEP